MIVAVSPDVDLCPAPPSVDFLRETPAPGDPSFTAALMEAAIATGADVVLPWSDHDALALAPEADAFAAAGLALVCPPRELVELACDKWATLGRLAEIGVSVPDSQLVQDGKQLNAAAAMLGYPEMSLVVKPRSLSGGQGVWVISAHADPTRTTPRPRVPLAAMAAMLDADAANDFIVQQEVQGEDVSVDLLADEGDLLAAVARIREATLGGLSVQGTVGPLDSSLASTIELLVSGLDWSSLANVQVMIGADGPVVYEINARASGSIGIAAHGGLDLLWGAIRHARGEPLPISAELHAPLRFRRYWSDQWWSIEYTGTVH